MFRLLSRASLTVLLLSSFATAAIIPVAGPFTNPSNGHQYTLLDRSTWTEGEAAAVAMGGHLVSVNSREEHDWLVSTFLSGADSTRILWIGLTDAASEGNFIWTSGEPLTFTFWYPGEPNDYSQTGGPENYVTMNWQYNIAGAGALPGQWNDDVNTGPVATRGPKGPFFAVAEVVPEPAASSLILFGLLGVGQRRRR